MDRYAICYTCQLKIALQLNQLEITDESMVDLQINRLLCSNFSMGY